MLQGSIRAMSLQTDATRAAQSRTSAHNNRRGREQGGEAPLVCLQRVPCHEEPKHAYSVFFLKEQPSVNRALPPVGWHSIRAQLQGRGAVAAQRCTRRPPSSHEPAADNNGRGVAEHRRDVKAARAAHVHEEAVRALQPTRGGRRGGKWHGRTRRVSVRLRASHLYQALLLVASLLGLRVRVKQVANTLQKDTHTAGGTSQQPRAVRTTPARRQESRDEPSLHRTAEHEWRDRTPRGGYP